MATIYLVGLGPGGKEGLALGAVEVLEKVSPLLLKTLKTPCCFLFRRERHQF